MPMCLGMKYADGTCRTDKRVILLIAKSCSRTLGAGVLPPVKPNQHKVQYLLDTLLTIAEVVLHHAEQISVGTLGCALRSFLRPERAFPKVCVSTFVAMRRLYVP